MPPSSRHRPARAALALLAAAAPALVRASSISIEGGAVVLGRTESVPVVIRVTETPGTEDLPLRISVNVGGFSEPVRQGPGKYRAIYVPPQTRYPQVALVALWRETGPDAPIDFLKFPLFGTTRIPVTTKPGAELTARLGFDRFGPVIADRRGVASIPVVVGPEASQAEVTIKDRAGLSVTKKLPLDVPPYNRLTAALVPHAVVADGKSAVRVHVYYDLGGADVPPDRVQVRPGIGRVGFLRAGRGRYVYDYVPPAGATARDVLLAFGVAGDPVAKAFAKVDLGLPPPARILIRSPATRVVAGNTAPVVMSAVVLDAAGLGLAGLKVELAANGEPTGPAVDRGGGVYEITWKPPAAYPQGGLVQFVARAADAMGRRASGSANYEMQVAPTPGSVAARFRPAPVPADGRTVARLELEVRDAAGIPLEHAQLIPVVSHGSLGKLEPRDRGRLEATYLAPDELPEGEAVLKLVDAGGAFEQRVPVPLRQDPHRLLVGGRGGYSLSPGKAAGPRFGADVWVPWNVAGATFGAGLSVTFGTASDTVTDPTGAVTSRSEATFTPVALKLGYEIWAGRRASVTIGGGGVATYARFKTTLGGPETNAWGFGGLGFVNAGWAAGPAHLYVELSYAAAPVSTADFHLDAGGPAIAAGVRLGVF